MHNRYQHRLEPLDFQEKAFNKFKSSDIAAIFFEQGLGKTKIAIDLMLHWLQNDFGRDTDVAAMPLPAT